MIQIAKLADKNQKQPLNRWTRFSLSTEKLSQNLACWSFQIRLLLNKY